MRCSVIGTFAGAASENEPSQTGSFSHARFQRTVLGWFTLSFQCAQQGREVIMVSVALHSLDVGIDDAREHN